ncbi:MAG: hypothetical protein JW719_14685, partial [Pirellulales bacterium]|nr:hypothetical protein [Pirellulales bacterium]
TIALAVDFQQPLGDRDPRNLALPIVAAEGVAHQSGLVAVEGNAELDVRVTTDARPVDVGELVDAEYQPGRRLLGVHGFVGEPIPVTIDAYRYPAYALAAAVVQRGRLTTRVSAEGVAQTKARFELRTKAPYLEIELPPNAQLWSVWLDGKPAKPQRQDQRLLLDLAGQGAGASRELQFFYETPLATSDPLRDLDVEAPRLLLRADQDVPPSEVPLVGLEWQLVLPWRYHVVDSQGTLTSGAVRPTEPALFRAARWLRNVALVGPTAGMKSTRQAARRRPATVCCEALTLADEVSLPEESEIKTETSEPAASRRRLARSSDKKIRADYDYDVDGDISEDQYQAFGRPIPESSKSDAQTEMAGKAAGGYGDFHAADFGLKGMRSLKVDFDQAQAGSKSTVVTFRSLGENPRLVVTVADRRRFASLGWALALAVVLVGVALGGRSTGAKFRLLVVLGLVFSLVPLVPGCQVLAEPLNMAFYATLLLIPYFLLLAGGRWFFAHFEGGFAGKHAASAAGAVLLVLATTAAATAGEPLGGDSPMRVELVDPLPEVRVPADAILIPYDPDSPGGIENANRCFVPYDQYRELWSRANPDRTPPAAPCDYALAGASYEARLADGDDLLLEGQIEIVVNKPSGVMVPLRLAGGVLAEAQLDGKPARLSVTQSEPAPGKTPSGPRTAVLLLHVSDAGRHTLNVHVRLRLARHGGWHVAEGVVPAAPASSLALTVPTAETDVQFGETADRRNFETAKPDEKIETVLGDGGRLRVEWRPKLARTEIEHSLTARSEALLDVQEDAARMIWDLELAFRQDQRRQFTVVVPEDWRIESVAGPNVRGWQSTVVGKTQRIDVALLKPAAGSERISLKLRRRGLSDELAVPVVAVDGAAIERGRVAIRRSPLLELRTTAARGVRRADFALPQSVAAGQATLDDPLGLRPYQAYEFASTPFSITLAAGPVRARTTAAVQSILRISDDKRSLESLVNLDVQGRPIYSAAFLLPEEFELENVDVLAPDFERNPAAAGGLFHWAITQKDQPRRRLTVFLTDGRLGRVPIVLRGKLGGKANASATTLPRLEVLGVERQSGDLAVQVDPSFRVEPRELANCQSVLLHRLFGWLRPDQRALVQLALHYDRPDIEGRLVLSRRSPRVSCTTITNVRVTDRAIEETILLDFSIRDAGIRQIVFTLPAWMHDCRIEVPMLREKTIAPTGPGADAPLRVTLDLQDEVMADAFRVLVKNDRLLTPGLQTAPIPVVATGETTRRFAVLESAGRDEIVPDDAKTAGLEPVNPRSKSYATLRQLLGEGITQAYLVAPGADRPELAFQTRQREAVATAGARIGLAETDLLVDASGAYRGRIVYHMDNSTEQFLPIKLPRGARLWSAQVAGKPVKPIRHPDASDDLHVCIPLIKTSAGELDYQIELIYGGRMAAVDSLGGKVEFPLLRTLDPRGKINLTPELSQVRLHLPKTHRWFDFDGTMRLVADEGLLAAGQVAYRNSQISQLSQTMQTGDEFAKIRAAQNLTGLQKQVGMAVRNASELNDNALFRKELADNEQLLEKAQQQAQIVKNAPQQTAEDDNRERLGSLYLMQQVNASRGAVSKAGRNFGDIEAKVTKVIVGADRRGGVKLNNQWYRNNNLVSPEPPRASAPSQSSLPQAAPAWSPPAAGQPPASTEGPAGIHDGMVNVNGAAIGGSAGGGMGGMMGGPVAIPSSGIQEGAQLNRPMMQFPATPQQTAPAKKPMSKQARYQQRYQEQAGQAAEADATAGPQPWSDSIGNRDGSTRLVDKSEEGHGSGFSMGFQRTLQDKPADARVRGRAAAAPPVTPSGLASLVIDFPTPEDAVYRTYRFTTPRGDVRITARPASVETLWTGRAVLIILAVFAALVLLVRTRLARWFATWPGGLTLVVIGALLTISCVMPLIGIVLAAAGIAVLVATRKS